MSEKDRDKLEIAGMTLCEIEDAVAHLLLNGAPSVTVADVLAVGPLPDDSESE